MWLDGPSLSCLAPAPSDGRVRLRGSGCAVAEQGAAETASIGIERCGKAVEVSPPVAIKDEFAHGELLLPK